MGLLDNIDDPQKQMLLQIGLGLLGGSGHTNKNFGADLSSAGQQGLLAYSNQRALQAKLAEEKQQQEMRAMQMQQMQRQQQDDTAIRGAYSRNVIPGQPQMQPNDYETPSGPAGPSSMNIQGLRNDLMGAGSAGFAEAMKLAAMTQKELIHAKPGETIGTRQGDRFVPMYSSPEKPPAGFTRGPDGNLVADKAYIDAQKEIRAAGKPAVDVKVNSFTPASEEAQKEFMKSSRATYDQLKQAPVALDSIEKAKALIPGAKGFMGPGGEGLLNATKFLNNRLGMSVKVEGVKDAEELRTRIFFNIMDNLKKMDAQPSQQQQQIMQEALGRMGTDPNALPAVLDAFAGAIKGKVDLYNQEVAGATQRGVKFPYDPVIKTERKAQQQSITLGGKSVQPRVAPDGKRYVQMGGKFYEVQD